MFDAIISIKPKHVENILAGVKTIELRTRTIKLPIDAKVWVYSTLPVGKICLSMNIDFNVELPPRKMWKIYGAKICISKEEFDTYTKGRSTVFAIGLKNINPMKEGLSLAMMRACVQTFHPPQFMLKLYPGSPLYSMLYD